MRGNTVGSGLTCPAIISRTFRARPESVAEARRFLAEFMAGSPVRPDAVVCLSELATNAISHSRSARRGGRFTLTACRAPAVWRVEVHDAGGPWRPSHNRDGTGHRGLVIVDGLAARWGIESRHRAGRVVWFEISDPLGAAP